PELQARPARERHRRLEPAAMTGPRVLVAGLPRSGTTWVGEVLGRCAGTRYLHEPDNHLLRPEAWWAKRALGPYPELRPGTDVDSAGAGDYERLWALAFPRGARPSPLYAGLKCLPPAVAAAGRLALRPAQLPPGGGPPAASGVGRRPPRGPLRRSGAGLPPPGRPPGPALRRRGGPLPGRLQPPRRRLLHQPPVARTGRRRSPPPHPRRTGTGRGHAGPFRRCATGT